MILLSITLQASTFYRVKKSKWAQETAPRYGPRFGFSKHIIRETAGIVAASSGVVWRLEGFSLICDL